MATELFVVEIREWVKQHCGCGANLKCPKCGDVRPKLETDTAYITTSLEKAIEFCRSHPDYSWKNRPWYWTICKETLDGINEAGQLDGDGELVTVFDWDMNEWHLCQPSPDAEIFKDCHKWRHPLWGPPKDNLT